jgi:hypothetical protein
MTSPAHDESALAAAALRARATTDRTLAAICAAGIIGITASLLTGRGVFALPFVALVMFGAWGIVDHSSRRNILRYSRTTRELMRRLKAGIATIGVIAIMAFAFAFFGGVLGVIIS